MPEGRQPAPRPVLPRASAHAARLRLLTALLLTPILATLILTSPVVHVLPPPPAPFDGTPPWGLAVVTALVLLVAAPVAVGWMGTRGMLTASVIGAAVHLYPYSRLDWFRLLKRFCNPDGTICLTGDAPAPVGAIVLAALPLLIVTAHHVLSHASRVEGAARAKGAPGDEPALARKAATRPGLRAIALAAGLTILGGGLYAGASAAAAGLGDAFVTLPLLVPVAVAAAGILAALPAFRSR